MLLSVPIVGQPPPHQCQNLISHVTLHRNKATWPSSRVIPHNSPSLATCPSKPVTLHSSLAICPSSPRSEEHTSELQSRLHLVCRLLLEKKKKKTKRHPPCHKTTATRAANH